MPLEHIPMKKSTLFILLFFSISSVYNAQTDTTITPNFSNFPAVKKTKTLKISTSSIPPSTLGELKDELIMWKNKVISIRINEKTNEFILIHNNLMQQAELFEVLKKYNIQKTNIISYK